MNFADLLARQFRPAGRGAGEGAVLDSVKPMFGLLPFLLGWRGAEHAQVAIILRAVGVDDHALDLLCKGERQRRLAARGRSGDDD